MERRAIHCHLALVLLSTWGCGNSHDLEPAERQTTALEALTPPGTFSFVQSGLWDIPVAVANTLDGGYVVGGTTNATSAGTEAWVIKFDAGGSRVWERRYGTPAADTLTDLLVASNGDIAFTGSMRQGSLNKSHDVWLVRLSADGDLLWQKAYGGINAQLNSGGHEQARALVETAEGSLAVVGETSSFARSGASYDVATAAFFLVVDGASGDIIQSEALVWSRYYNDAGRRNTSASSILRTADGGFAIAGVSSGNFWAVKLGLDGVPLWMNHYGYTTHDRLDSLVQDADGHLVLAGSTCNTSGTDCDVWVVKVAQGSGDFLWVQKFDGASHLDPYEIRKTSTGFAIAGTHAPVGAPSATDPWLIHLDAQGNLGPSHPGTWQKTYSGLRGSSFAPRPEGGFLFTGLRPRPTGGLGTNALVMGTDATGDVACPVVALTEVSSTPGVLTREVCPLPPTEESCCTDSLCGSRGQPPPDNCEAHETCVTRVCVPKPVDWVRGHVLTARETSAVSSTMGEARASCQ